MWSFDNSSYFYILFYNIYKFWLLVFMFSEDRLSSHEYFNNINTNTYQYLISSLKLWAQIRSLKCHSKKIETSVVLKSALSENVKILKNYCESDWEKQNETPPYTPARIQIWTGVSKNAKPTWSMPKLLRHENGEAKYKIWRYFL